MTALRPRSRMLRAATGAVVCAILQSSPTLGQAQTIGATSDAQAPLTGAAHVPIKPAHHHVTRGKRPTQKVLQPSAKPLVVAKPPAPTIQAPLPIPPAAPPAPVLPPPVLVPTRPPPPPPPASVVLGAAGDAVTEKDGLRLTFGPDLATLNPTTDAAVRALAHADVSNAETFNVTAYAAGAADDPSAARRLSLSRALAVRSILIAEGIPSVRIYVKALGAPAGGDTPADRVDIVTERSVVPSKSHP